MGNASGYSIVGTGDFSGDGTSDVLLQNSSGALIDWTMNNGAIAAAHYLGTAAGWTVSANDWTMANGVVSGAALIDNTAGYAIKHQSVFEQSRCRFA